VEPTSPGDPGEPILFLLGTEQEDAREQPYRLRSDPQTAILDEVVDVGSGPVRTGRTAVQERIRGARRIGQLADALVRYRLPGQLRSPERPPIALRAVALDEDGIRWELPPGAIAPAPPFFVEITGYNSIFQVPVARAVVRDGCLVTAIPDQVTRLRRRWRRRVVVNGDHFLRFRHPLQPTSVRCEIRDLSDGGLSFRANPERDLVYPGLILPDVEIVAPGGAALVCDAEVRFVNRDLCGVRVFHRSAADEQRWLALVTRALHPRTSSDARYSDAAWRLYERAGYFQLSGKRDDEFTELRHAFASCERRIEDAPHLGCRVVWPTNDGEAFAALSVLRLYHGTWLGYQMAKVHGDQPNGAESRQILRDIHLHAYEHAQLDPSLRWLLGWAQVKPVWSRLVHHDLPERYRKTGLSCVLRFRALEASSAVEHDVAMTDVTIGPATPLETELFVRKLSRARPRPYLEAHDLVGERIDLAEVKRQWRAAGLHRERALLIARRARQPLAAALVETAEPGLHLFRLLDQARLYPLTVGGEAAFDALLAGARDWFRAAGRDRFVLFLEEGSTLRAPTLATLNDLGEADMTILSAEVLPELLEHLVEVTAPRQPRQ